MKQATSANIFLILCAIIWGVTFTVIKTAVTHISPSMFVSLRFLLASVCFAYLIRKKLKFTNKRLIKETLVLGLFNALVYIAQTTGLQTESSANIAFLNAMNIIFIPLLSPLFRLSKPTVINLFCCFFSVIGIYILTGANFHSITVGDFWGLISALSFALSVLYLQKITFKVREFGLLAFYQVFFTLPLPILLSIGHSIHHIFYPSVLIALFYCAIFSTCLTFFWQTKYQRKTTPTKAALIYLLEPVFAIFFAYIINGEPVYEHTIIGGLVIIVSVGISEFGVFLIPRKRC